MQWGKYEDNEWFLRFTICLFQFVMSIQQCPSVSIQSSLSYSKKMKRSYKFLKRWSLYKISETKIVFQALSLFTDDQSRTHFELHVKISNTCEWYLWNSAKFISIKLMIYSSVQWTVPNLSWRWFILLIFQFQMERKFLWAKRYVVLCR